MHIDISTLCSLGTDLQFTATEDAGVGKCLAVEVLEKVACTAVLLLYARPWNPESKLGIADHDVEDCGGGA